MVTGFTLETAPLNQQEKKLVPGIIRGLAKRDKPELAIHGRDICFAVSDSEYRLKEPRLRKITNFLRSAKILPVMATSKGYYVSYETEEIQRQIKSLEERRDAIQTAIDGLKKWL